MINKDFLFLIIFMIFQMIVIQVNQSVPSILEFHHTFFFIQANFFDCLKVKEFFSIFCKRKAHKVVL